MNKYIILLILLLLIIIFYFTYKHDKGNKEKFTEANINTNYVLNYLDNNNLSITDNGTIEFKINMEEKLPINYDNDNDIVTIGDEVEYDSINNNLKCGNYNLDKNGTFKDNENKFIRLPNGNIYIDKLIYNEKEGKLIKSGDDNNINNINIDSNGNINFNDYLYTTNGIITKKDNTVQFDPSGNIIIKDYTINAKENKFKKNDNTIFFENNGSFKCGKYEINNNENKIKIGQNNYTINNGIISDSENKFSIDPNGLIKMNSNKYVYNSINNQISGNTGLYNQFNINNNIFYQNNDVIHNYDGNGSTIYAVSEIILEKPASADTYNKPLHISSIRFFDYNNTDLWYLYFSVTVNNIANGQYATSGTYTKYFDATKNLSTSYGGPVINAYTIWVNKTKISYSTGQPVIVQQNSSLLQRSQNFVGCGLYNQPYLDGITYPNVPTAGLTQQYIFRFPTPKFIKYVEIDNRKDGFTNRIFGAYLNTYIIRNGKKTLISNINCVETSQNTLSDLINTKLQPVNKHESYSALNYGGFSLPTNYKPIIRYYVQ